MAHNEYKEPRGRNFAFVQLIENVPENWREILEDKLIPCAYIVHDKDVNEETGELKKAHVHVFVYFNGKKTISGVLGMFSEFNISHVEKIECKNAYLAYMLHIGKQGKHQYDYDELKIMNGLKVNYADLNDVDLGDVLDFARMNNITRFSEFVNATKKVDPPLFRYAQGHYGLLCAYFSDVRED